MRTRILADAGPGGRSRERDLSGVAKLLRIGVSLPSRIASPANDRAMQRMVQAGVTPMTSQVVLGELQRDWARQDSYTAATEIARTHYGNWGQVIRFHYQLAPAVKGHTTMQIAA